MKRANLIGIIFLCCLMVLSGCTHEDTNVSNIEKVKKEQDITLYIKEEVALAPYEPVDGTYLGADVASDVNIRGDILAFDKLIGGTNLFHVFQYDPEVRLQNRDILKCIAHHKIPYIKLYYTDAGNLISVYRLAMDLKNSYTIPVFIELYPLTEGNKDASSYKATYEKAYKVIKAHIPSATIVWSSSDACVSESMIYYPGDKYVDWVGLNIYIPRYKLGEAYIYNGQDNIDLFYKLFQKDKPMMISGLAISHFSRVDCTYTIYDTEKKLEYFYAELLKAYPRIKGIIYADMDMAKIRETGKEDYTLTNQPNLATCMQELLAQLKILTRLEAQEGEVSQLYMRYDITGSLLENELYIPERYMKILFKKVPLSKLTYIEDLEGERFFAFRDIKRYADCYYKNS